MKVLVRLTIALLATTALFAVAAHAAPASFAAGQSHDQRKAFKQQQHERDLRRQHMQRHDSRRHGQQHPGSGYRPRDHAHPPGHRQIYQQRHQYQQRKPPHRDQLRRQIHQSRYHQIGRGPALPPHVHLVVGRPIPYGWAHPLAPAHVRHLPHYAGYEWRRAGSDLILVAVTTGLIYAIVDNVLN